MENIPDCVWPLQALLGEGPTWNPREACLWFVDIKSRRVHRYRPASGERSSWAAPDQVSFVASLADGRHVAGLASDLHLFDPQTGRFELLREVEPAALGNRTNDATVDAAGRLWFGTMHDATENESGALYSLCEGTLRRHDEGYIITNGPACSPDGRTLYHADTHRGLIHAFDLHADGALSGRREFARIEPARGSPDGLTVDSAGRLWVGLWGGWGAQAFLPDGRPDAFVPLPCANVTKVAFGDADLRTMYFTSARIEIAPEALAAQPLAGGLFALRSKVPGLPTPVARALASGSAP